MDGSVKDESDQPIDIQDYAGALLDGLESLKDSDVSLEEVQDRFDQLLDDKSSKLGNLELAQRLELKVLARPRSSEAQLALEAGFENMKALWTQAINEADSRLAAAGQNISNTVRLAETLKAMGELAGATGNIFNVVQFEEKLQSGDTIAAGNELFKAVGGYSGALVGAAVFGAGVAGAAAFGIALTGATAILAPVVFIGAASYGGSELFGLLPDSWKEPVGDFMADFFSGSSFASEALRQKANELFRDEAVPRYLQENLQSVIAAIGDEDLTIAELQEEFLGDIDPAVLADRAKTDPATLYALVNGHFFAVNNDLPIYDDPELDVENYTDEYLRDRAEYINTFFAFRLEESDTLYLDFESQISAGGDPSSVGLSDQVIFGSDRNEQLEGGAGSDNIYGGKGNDTLVGDNEDDYLEGNQGKDRLDGGRGDDILVGGTDNDELLGGIGIDEYRFSPGDGADTIRDIDGLGRILIGDDTELVGTNEVAALEEGRTVWQSADGETVYTLVDGSLDGGTLQITGPGFEADDSITIQDFRNGDLGINLNPERNITLTPGNGGSSTTLVEGGARAFQLELNRPAEAGDRIVLSLGGEGADAVVARFGGDVLRFADGDVTLTLEEGQQAIDFSLVSEGDVDATAELDLDAVYQNDDGESQTDPASVIISLEADETPDNETGGGQQVVGDYAWADGDASEPGFQYDYDALGNRVYETPLQNAPGQNDVLFDGAGNETIEGRGGDDLIVAQSGGDDHLLGGDGDDFLASGPGNDLVEGESGSDVLLGDVEGEAGDDRLYGDTEVPLEQAILEGNTASGSGQRGDLLAGMDGDDLLVGSNGNDVLSGGSSDDTLVAGAGDDFIFGDRDYRPFGRFTPEGNDNDDNTAYEQWDTSGIDWQASLNVTESGDDKTYSATITNSFSQPASAPGNDLIYAGAGDDYVIAGDGDDVVYAESGDDVAFGGRGNDTLVGGEGNDTLNGDNGRIASSDHGDDFIDGGAGDDILFGGGGANAIFGGADNDQIFGGSGDSNDGNNLLYGEAGDDVVVGGSGADLIFGGSGNDQLAGEAGNMDPELHDDDRIYGGSGDDEITGGGGDDRLWGGDGDDVMDGDLSSIGGEYHGDDVLEGNAGNDTLFGSGGHDTLRGGEGNDTLLGDGGSVEPEFHGNDRLEGGVGDDTLIGGGGSDELYGGSGNDTLDGDGGGIPGEAHSDDFLDGGDGEDQLIGNGGSDVLVGGEGNDQLFGDAGDLDAQYHGDDLLDGGSGDDLLAGNGGKDSLFGGAGDDSLLGDSSDLDAADHQDDYLDGGEGNDTLIGHGGDDTLIGGLGDDALNGDSQSVAGEFHGDDYLQGGVGNDNLVGAGGADILFGGDSADLLYGDASWVDASFHGNDYLQGGAGNDQLLGHGGDDTLLGGTGNDLIGGGIGNDYLSGGSADDRLFGDQGDDYLAGGDGDDRLFGGAGDDTLIGGAGFDLLSGGAGNDILSGGEGFDAYSFGYGDGNISILDVGSNVLRFGGGIQLGGIRLGIGSLKISLEGTDDAVHIQGFDRLNPYESTGIDRFEFADGTVLNYQEFIDLGFDFSGTDGDDVLRGTNATDRLQGFSGDDRIIGLDGDDVLDGGTGADVMEGGPGDDEYLVDSAGDQVVEAAGEGRDHIITDIDLALGDNVEDLSLADSATNGTGNTLDNRLNGNDSQNHLQGLSGDDVLDGRAGDDLLEGGAGNDTLKGGEGADILDGGTGSDSMYGGAGDDTYHVDSADDQAIENSGAGYDTVQSSVSYTLNSDVEELQLVGGQAFEGTGNASDNLIQGNALDNRLEGLGGDDVLKGGGGDDFLVGGAGADSLSGGTGDDIYMVDENDTVLEAADEGTDTVQSANSYALDENVENLVLTGGSVDGTGNDLDNHIVGSGGANTLYGAGGVNTLEGGLGNDTYIIDSTQNTVVEDAFGGTDTVEASVDHTLADNVERLILTEGSAEIGRGNTSDNFIQGNSGDNRLFGESGSDRLYGGEGDDTIQGGTGEDSLYGQAGSDTLRGGEGNDYLDGGEGADQMAGGAGSDTYIVDDADDGILESAGEGYDVVESSVTYTLWDNLEELYLTGSDDIGGSGNAQDNRLFGNFSSNRLDGGAGDDYLDGGLGGDTMIGGAGDDVFIVDSSADQTIEQSDEGHDTVQSSVTYNLSNNVEDLVLTGDSNTSGYGNVLDNAMLGNDAANSLQGEAGDDNIDGAGGNDSLSGGDGDDYIYGGDDAVISGSNPYGGDYGYGGYYGGYYGGDYGYGGRSSQITPNDDLLEGGNGNDYLDGGSGDDTLYGDDGDDYLYGGDDGLAAIDSGYGGSSYYGGDSYYGGSSYGGTIFANSNNDLLYGGNGRDTLDGGNGDDELYGGDHEDVLIGGTGDDLLDGGAGLDDMAGGQGNDVYYVDGYSEIIESPGDGGEGDDDPDDGNDGHDETDCPPSSGKGNEGLGNGQDAPPPGHDTNWNDGPGTSPGNPGSKGGANAGRKNDNKRGSDNGGLATRGNQPACGTGADGCSTFGEFGDAVDESGGANEGGDTEVRWFTDEVTEQAGNGYDIVYSSATFTLPENVEELRLTGNDAIDATGSDVNNFIYGNSAANRLNGGGGSNRLVGGAGDDTYVVDSLADTLVESSDGGNDTVESAVDYSLGSHIENLTLTGQQNLSGDGTDAGNRLNGNAGDNVLSGLGGNDVLSGGAGNDLLRGGDGDDTYVFRLGDGVNRIEDTAGTNTLRFEGGLTAANVVARSNTVEGITTVHLRLVDTNGNEMPDQGVDFTPGVDGMAPISLIEFADGSSATVEDLQAEERTIAGSRRRDSFTTGQEDDSFHLGRGNDILVGGAGADSILVGDGNDVVLYNMGDGADRITSTDSSDYTVSIGGEFRLDDLSLSRQNGELTLQLDETTGHPGRGRKAGRGNSISFEGWGGTDSENTPHVTLQLVMSASADFDAGSSDPLLSQQVQRFDFNELVEAFEASGQDQWAVTDALLESHLANESDAALGGNFAKRFGTSGSVGDLSATGLIGALADPELGEKPQSVTVG